MKSESGAFERGGPLPYFLIGAMGVLCHGFILTNDGRIWDSWWLYTFLEHRSWATMHHLSNEGGTPLFTWLMWPFTFAPDIMTSLMWATFLCLLADGILTYHLAQKLGRLARSEALALTLLAQAMPLFSAAQDIMMFFYIFTHTLFLLAALLAVVSLEMPGPRRWVARGLAVLAFYLSFNNGALLVFYGCFYPLFFFRYRLLRNLEFFAAIRRFLMRYPEFLLLPPATWLVRITFTPQYGWYAHHTDPGANLQSLVPILRSFFTNVLPYHFKVLALWPKEHPLVVAALVLVVVLFSWRAPKDWCAQRGPLSSIHLVWFGGVSLFLAIFPFAAAGKWFLPQPLGEFSRYCILTGLPLACLLLALLRLLFLGRAPAARWFAPIVGGLAVVLAVQIFPVYLNERAEWVYSNSVLRQAIRNDAVRDSSVIVLQGYSIVRQDAYGLNGFASAFGSLTRLVTGRAPANRRFFTPAEIKQILVRTTIASGEFKHIDPSGRQIHLMATRTRPQESDWGVVSGYLKTHYFGTEREMDAYLASLVSLQVAELKPASPLTPAFGIPDPGSPDPGLPQADFTNGVGMRMVKLPDVGWASAFETTQAQYLRLTPSNPSLFKDPSRPVESVSWHEAADYCTRLSELEAKAGRLPTGHGYRLPTLREFDQISAGAPPGYGVMSVGRLLWQTAGVGSLPPDRLGLSDVLGNVWEWCLDWADGAHRYKVSRGGSWVSHAQELQPYSGGHGNIDPYADPLYGPVRKDYPDQGFWDRGFRCLLAPAVTAPDPPVTRGAR